MSVLGRIVRGASWRRGAFASLCALAVMAFVSGRSAEAEGPALRGGPEPAALRELGRRLFFDPVGSSRSGMRACVDCHRPEHGFSDPARFSADDLAPTTRHSQSLIDAGDSATAHWDGEFTSMRALVTGRLNVRFLPDGTARYGSGGSARQLASGGAFQREVRFEPRLPDAVAAVQQDPGVAPEAERVAERRRRADELVARVEAGFAVPGPVADARPAAPFLRADFATLLPRASTSLEQSGRYREAFEATFGDHETPSEERIAGAIAEYCHSIRSGESPYDRYVAGDGAALSTSAKRGLALFTGSAGCAACHTVGPRTRFFDDRFHNTGIAWKGGLEGRGDLGRQQRTGKTEDVRAFKTPSLRDVSRSAPYMHDGSLATLEAAVRHYATRPTDPSLDPAYPSSFSPTDADVADLVAFLESLTSDVRPGLATTTWEARAPRTRLRFVDVDGRPVPGLRVTLDPAGDVLPGGELAVGESLVQTTGTDGTISFAPLATTHTRLVLPLAMRPVGGDLVPDTCREADVVLPIGGTARVVVVERGSAEPPEVLTATHPRAERLPGGRPPQSRFQRVDVERTADGHVLSTYLAPFRVDVGGRATLAWPRADGTTEPMEIAIDPRFASIVTLP